METPQKCEASDVSQKDETKLVRLSTFVQEISISGMKYVVVAQSYFRKVFWLSLVLAASGFACYQIYQRCAYFATRPLSTQIYTNRTHELPFPIVTLCSDNKVNRTQLEKIGGYQLVEDFQNVYPFGGGQLETIEHFWDDTNNWTDVYYSALSVHPPEMIMWNALSYESNYKVVSTELGACVQLNTENKYLSHTAGPENGMLLDLIVNDTEFVTMDGTSYAAGFRIALHQAGDEPLMKQNGIRVGRGVQTSIAIKAQKITNPGLPYTNCSEKPGYSYSKCIKSCLTDYFVSECSCKQLFMEGPSPVCSLKQEFECGKDTANDFIAYNKAQDCECPDPCTQVRYSYSISFSTMSDYILDQARILGKPQDFAVVNLFYSDIAYEELKTTSAYTPLALLCDIGGALGLFLGSTFLTILEIMEFTFIEIVAHFGKKNEVTAFK